MMYFYRPGHPKASPGGFVSGEDLSEIPMDPPRALDAPIMAGRCYDGQRSHLDGTDIGNRWKYKQYTKEHNLTTIDDFTDTWAKAAKERERVRAGDFDHKERRELLGKLEYEGSKNARRR